MSYRRKWGSQTWHTVPNCPHWPFSAMEAEERDERPIHGELCSECQSRELAAMTSRSPRSRGADSR